MQWWSSIDVTKASLYSVCLLAYEKGIWILDRKIRNGSLCKHDATLFPGCGSFSVITMILSTYQIRKTYINIGTVFVVKSGDKLD